MNISKIDEFNNSKISLNRKIMEWEWYTEPKTSHLFVHCLLRANFKDNRYRGITIKRGQFLTSISKLSIETGLSFREVRTALKRLIATSELTQETHSQYSIITVNNYNKYQEKFKKVTSGTTSERQTNDKQVTTNNNDNNEINNNKNNIIENYKKFKNVYLTDEQYRKLSVEFMSEKRLLNLIEELSDQIAIGKEKPFSEELPELHFTRLRQYYRYQLTHNKPTYKEKNNGKKEDDKINNEWNPNC